MKLLSARQAWHDCTYQHTRCPLEPSRQLGDHVQARGRIVTANAAVHGAISGWIQSAIARLPAQFRVFGNFMYAPRTDARHAADVSEAAEHVILQSVMCGFNRMTTAKQNKLEYVVKGVMRRYRHMHQGGQSANPDPLPNAERFRGWLLAEYGVKLESRNWTRDWVPAERLIFAACDEFDRRALGPIQEVINRINLPD